MIEGKATASGTARRAARQAAGEGWWRSFGATGWTCGALGFGAYRVTDRPDEAKALQGALDLGVNLVDTANNYGLGRSEALVGRALADAFAAGRLARDEVVVVTKVGYLQGGPLEAVRDEVEAGADWAVTPVRDDHWHTLDGRLLARLLDISRRRLGLATVDVALLHNPELLLSGDPAAFYAAVRGAFERLEALADQGHIQAYGVSSNTLGAPDSPARTDLDRLLGLAHEVAGAAHRFRVVQLPLNPVEDAGLATAARAADLGLAVLTNRPLNALVDDRVLRLADPGDDAAADDFPEARRALGELEQRYRREIGPDLRLPPATLPTWSSELPRAMQRLGSALDFDLFRRVQADASLEGPFARIAARLGPPEAADPAATAWLAAYRAAWERLMAAARAQLARRDRLRLAPVMARVARELPPPLDGAPWSRRAVAWSATRPGVSAALVGMRRPAWVADLAPLAAAGLPASGLPV